MSKLCPECGNTNINSAKFCDNCGSDLKDLNVVNDTKSTNIIESFNNWWNGQSTNGKAITGILAFCIGMFLLIIVVGALAPESTALSVNNSNAQIDENTTEFIINGTTEKNAKVYISSSDLNLTNVEIAVDNKTGNFQYKLVMPVDITDINVKVSAKSPDKVEYSKSITIQRPLTPITINPVPTLKTDANTATIEGKTDPNAEVKISSNNLNISETIINADSNGNFKYTINVPTGISSASILIKVKSIGKRAYEQTVSITRESPPQPSKSTDSSSSSSSSDSGKSSSSTSSNRATGTFVGSINSNVYHYPSCASAKRIHSENLITFSSVTEAKNAGYRPCKTCHPPG